MSSKFGVLGEVDKLLAEVRRDVNEAANHINLVRRTMLELPRGQWDDALLTRLCDRLQEAENQLDALIQR